MVVFTILGCQLAIEMKLPALIVIISGMITGCAGGIRRDLLCNDVPLIFQKEMYAGVSFVTGGIYMIILNSLGTENHYATIPEFFIGLTFRQLAVYYDWSLPKFIYKDDSTK